MLPKEAVSKYLSKRYDTRMWPHIRGDGSVYYIVYVDQLEFRISDLGLLAMFRFNQAIQPVRLHYEDPFFFDHLEQILAYKYPTLTLDSLRESCTQDL